MLDKTKSFQNVQGHTQWLDLSAIVSLEVLQPAGVPDPSKPGIASVQIYDRFFQLQFTGDPLQAFSETVLPVNPPTPNPPNPPADRKHGR